MYLFLYSAQTLLQYYVTKMDVHVCIFFEKKTLCVVSKFWGKKCSRNKAIKPTLNLHLHLHLSDAFIQSDLHCIQVTVLHLTSSCFPWESNP